MVTIPWGKPDWKPGSEYFLTVRFSIKGGYSLGKGRVLSWPGISFPIPVPAASRTIAIPGKVNFSQEGMDWVASVNGTRASVWTAIMAGCRLLRSPDRKILFAPLRPNFLASANGQRYRVEGSRNHGGLERCRPPKPNCKISTRLKLPRRACGSLPTSSCQASPTNLSLSYLLRGDGSVGVALHLEVAKIHARTAAHRRSISQFRQRGVRSVGFGRGPQENVLGPKKPGRPSVCMRPPSMIGLLITFGPQENANRTDVRWIKFTGAHGSGLEVRLERTSIGRKCMGLIRRMTWKRQLMTINWRPGTLSPSMSMGWQMGIGGDISWGLSRA